MNIFNLENAISDWRKQLSQHSGLEPGHTEELELHLRDAIDDLVAQGQTEEEAFAYATSEKLTSIEESAIEIRSIRSSGFATPKVVSSWWVPELLPNMMKVMLRNLRRKPGYAFINIFGLAIGIACCLMIFMYVQDELSYDRFHEKGDRIYRVNQSYLWGDTHLPFSSTGPNVAVSLREGVPEIEEIVRIHTPPAFTVTIDPGASTARQFDEQHTLAADSSFFDVFTYPLLHGDPSTALSQPNTVVITESIARKYFNKTDVIGEQIFVESGNVEKLFLITGVVEERPIRSHFNFTMIASMSSFPLVERRETWSWVWTQFVTYVLLDEQASVEQVRAKLPALVEQNAAVTIQQMWGLSYDEYIAEGKEWNLYLQPLTDIWLHSQEAGNRFGPVSDVYYVYIFSAIAILIIALACTNFMNLSTAQSTKRAKEVGIRKTLGSNQHHLVLQFLGESILFSLMAMIFALALSYFALPELNQLTGKQFEISTIINLPMMAGILLFSISIGVLAGIYPAFYLTSFAPIQVLKNKVQTAPGNSKFSFANLRNGLVGFQFVISISLIISTLIIFKQLDYIQNKDLGFDKNGLLVLHNTELLNIDSDTFKQQLKKEVGNIEVAYSNAVPPNMWNGDFLKPYGASDQSRLSITDLIIDEDLPGVLDLEFIKGRNFSKDRPGDIKSIILNETAVQQIQWNANQPNPDFPIGEILQYGSSDSLLTVIGVIKDFNYRSLHSTIPPLVLFRNDADVWDGQSSYYTIKVTNEMDTRAVISDIEGFWKSTFPATPFRYSFVDEDIAQLYISEENTGTIFGTFTTFAILIACLGLLGLSAFIVEQRTKEIGIRKVLGASVQSIVFLISNEFLKLVLISFIIAIPIAYFLMQNWLQDFNDHIALSPATFLVGGIAALVVALLTISSQSIKAAIMNPVKSLKSE